MSWTYCLRRYSLTLEVAKSIKSLFFQLAPILLDIQCYARLHKLLEVAWPHSLLQTELASPALRRRVASLLQTHHVSPDQRHVLQAVLRFLPA